MRLRPAPISRAALAALALCFPTSGAGATEAEDAGREEAGLIADLPFAPDTPETRITVDLAPDGQRPFVLMLDTGANTSVMSVRAARARGVSVRSLKRSPYRKRTRLGRDLLFLVDSRRSDTGAAAPFEFAVLGADFLDDYVVELDYPGRRVRFFDPDVVQVAEMPSKQDESSEPSLHVFPFVRNGTRMLVEAELEGHAFLALFDTGAPGVVVTKPVADEAGIDASQLGEPVETTWIQGKGRTRVYEARRLRVGDWLLPSMPILIEESSPMNLPHGGVLGYDVWGRAVVRIDFPRRRISVREPEGGHGNDRNTREAKRVIESSQDVKRVMPRTRPPDG